MVHDSTRNARVCCARCRRSRRRAPATPAARTPRAARRSIAASATRRRPRSSCARATPRSPSASASTWSTRSPTRTRIGPSRAPPSSRSSAARTRRGAATRASEIVLTEERTNDGEVLFVARIFVKGKDRLVRRALDVHARGRQMALRERRRALDRAPAEGHGVDPRPRHAPHARRALTLLRAAEAAGEREDRLQILIVEAELQADEVVAAVAVQDVVYAAE